MNNLVADSSFFLCFLDDISRPNELCLIMDKFKTHICPKIEVEISKSVNYQKISSHKNLTIFNKAPFSIGKVLAPFFSKKQIEKGENEVIVLAYIAFQMDNLVQIIFDDGVPRKFIEANLPYLKDNMVGTVGMVGIGYCNYGIFSKSESLRLLDLIESSKFKVTRDIINKVRASIMVC